MAGRTDFPAALCADEAVSVFDCEAMAVRW
jgi:hypothetical protein